MSTPPFPAEVAAIHRAVIPAAGLGTRLRPLTNAIPKELLPIGRLPVLAHVAAELRSAGFTEALFIVSDSKPQIRSYFGDLYAADNGCLDAPNHLPPLRCSYVVQTQQRGLGDALLYAEEWTDGLPFAVAFGDCIIDAPDPSAPLRRLVAAHTARSAGATVLTEAVPRENVFRYGVLAPETSLPPDGNGVFRVAGIVEKPSPEDAPSNLVVAARWILGPAIFTYLRRSVPDSRGEIGLTDAVRDLINDGGAVWAAPLKDGEQRSDIGNFETFFAAFVRAAIRDKELGSLTRGVAASALAAFDSKEMVGRV
jgi:UTP--glucose-1-phosphate uridylyltransferase